jgi:predicted nucleotidyltransferase
MTEYKSQLAQVCARLNEAGALYVLVGARALQLWGSSRATRDIDILIEPTVENARRVLSALSHLGFGVANEWLAEEVARKEVTVIGDMPKVDILTVAWSMHYRDARPAATIFALESVEIPTISIDHLIASKRTGRLQDAADIEVLEEIRRIRNERSD